MPAFERDRRVDLPLERLLPCAAVTRIANSLSRGGKRAAIAQVLAKRADARHQLRAGEQIDEGTERLDAAEPLEFLDGALLLGVIPSSPDPGFPVPGHAVAGSPFFSRSSIAAMNVSISSSGV